MKKRFWILLCLFAVLLAGALSFLLLGKHKHNFGEWTTIKEATCTLEGEEQRTCECGETEINKLSPLGHHYTGAEEWTENEVQYVSAYCGICGARDEIVYEGIYLDETNEMYLWNCSSAFFFDVKCAEGEEYVRQNVRVTDSFLRSLDPLKHQEICEGLTVEALGNDVYRVFPAVAYEEAKQYTALLGNKMSFCYMPGSAVTFRIDGEAEQVVEYNQNILFLKTMLDEVSDTYEYIYDDETKLHTLTLFEKGVLSDDCIGKIMCIGDCESFEEIKSAVGEIVFGKIESISETGSGSIVTLSNPTLGEVYDRINVNVGAVDSIVEAATSESFQEELLYQVASSEGFAEALTAARIAALDYADAQDMTAKDSPFDIDNFTITYTSDISGKEVTTPWVSIKFKVEYKYEVPIQKGEYKGSLSFNIVFDVNAIYRVLRADTNYQVEDGKYWWDGMLQIDIELVQTWNAQLDIQINLDVHDMDPQMDYIISKSGKIHRYSCMTCESLRKDRNNLVTLEEVKKIPNYEDNECEICKPFTMTDSQFILNLDSDILHCGNCEDAMRITKAEVIVYELYPFGGTFKNCTKCQPQDNSGLDKFVKNSLNNSEWNVALEKVKEAIGNELKAKDLGETDVDRNKPTASIKVFYVFDLKFYLQPKFDFDLEASLRFNYKLKTQDIYIIESQLDENENYCIVGHFDEGNKEKVNEDTWSFDLQGKSNARIGVMAEATFGFIGIPDAYIGLYAETGIYADLNGILHLESKGENYYGANLKAGIYFDARVTYRLFDIIEPGSIRLLEGDDYVKIPLFESGDSKAYYGFTYEGAEVIIQNGLRGKLKKDFLKASYYDLESMEKGSDTLSWFGDNDYSLKYRFEDEEGNEITYLGVLNDEVLIFDGAPDNFTAYLYVQVVDEITPRNLLEYIGTYNEDGCSFMMDELCITVKVSDAEEHIHSYTVEEQPATCTEEGWTKKICSCGDVIDEIVIDKIDHIYVDGKCSMCGKTDDVVASQGLEFTSNGDGTCTVMGIGTCTDTDIVIPATYNGERVTSINGMAFINCRLLTSIEIPNGVTAIYGRAFESCTSLTSVVIPDSVTYIDDCAFYDCSNLTSIKIPNSVMSIGDCAFSYCSSLTSIIIGDSVTSIGEDAFAYCTLLTGINIPPSVTNIGNGAFLGCIQLKEISVHKNNASYCSENGVLFNKAKTHLVCYLVGKTGTSYSIPASVTSIDKCAFTDCSSLASIIIGDSVTVVDSWAFSGCENLTNIQFNGTTVQWQAIAFGAYWNSGTGNYTVTCTDGTVSKDGIVTPFESAKAPSEYTIDTDEKGIYYSNLLDFNPETNEYWATQNNNGSWSNIEIDAYSQPRNANGNICSPILSTRYSSYAAREWSLIEDGEVLRLQPNFFRFCHEPH